MSAAQSGAGLSHIETGTSEKASRSEEEVDNTTPQTSKPGTPPRAPSPPLSPLTALSAVSTTSDDERAPHPPRRKPKVTPRIHVIESSPEGEGRGRKRRKPMDKARRQKTTDNARRLGREPDLPVISLPDVMKNIPAIKVVPEGKASEKGVRVKFYGAKAGKDPVEYEFKAWERTVSLICFFFSKWKGYSFVP